MENVIVYRGVSDVSEWVISVVDLVLAHMEKIKVL